MHGVMYWAIIVGFIVGVSISLGGYGSYVYAELILSSTTLLLFLQRYLPTLFSRVALLIIFFSIGSGVGIIRTMYSLEREPSIVLRCSHERSTVTGTVSAEPDQRDASLRTQISVSMISCKQKIYETHEHIIASLPPHSDVEYGDHITITGTVTSPTVFETGGGVFDYPDFLLAQNISATVDFAYIVSREHSHSFSFVKIILAYKKKFLEGEKAVLPEPASALASGVLIGDKRSVGPDLQKDFQRTSLTHILVLSGYNVTVVIDWLLVMLRFAPRIVQSSGVMSVALVFIVLSGGASSAVRAVGMTTIALVARMYVRRFDALRALGIVGVIMVFLQPMILWYDPSFQLSFLATLGLIVYAPIISSFISFVPERFGVRELCSATIATCFFVSPYLLMTNGSLSIVAIPANMSVLISMPFVMVSSFVAGMAGMMFGSWGTVCALPAFFGLTYILDSTEWWSSVPFATISVSHVSIGLVSVWYALLCMGWLYQKQNRPKSAGSAFE